MLESTETEVQEVKSPTPPSPVLSPFVTGPQQPAAPAIQDDQWMVYVARLAPDDTDAAFLLPGELPDDQATPPQIQQAISTATRRAFGHQNQVIEVEAPVMGHIQGTMRVLLPQGREHSYRFNNELGWKATIILRVGQVEEMMVAYYRRACMNPMRRAIYGGGRLDTSQVTFTPLDQAAMEEIAANPRLDRITAHHLQRLQRQYQRLSRSQPRP